MSDKQKVIQCYHCGNETLMNNVGEHTEHDYEGDGIVLGHTISSMYLCPVCSKVSFLEQYWDINQRYYDDNGEEQEYTIEKILYPMTTTYDNDSLPNEIRSAFHAALKCKNIDSAICLIALRRTLEFVCLEKQATGRDLWHKIEDLSRKGILPAELRHASLITKNYGNMGAHDTKVNISHLDLELIIEFVEYVLDYLYVLPSKLKKMQEKMGRPQTKLPEVGQVEPTAEIEENEDA